MKPWVLLPHTTAVKTSTRQLASYTLGQTCQKASFGILLRHTLNDKSKLIKAPTQYNTNLRSSNNKTSTRLKVINSFLIQVFCRDNSLDHTILQGSAHILQRNGFIMLHRYHNGVNTHWDDCSVLLDILNRDLNRTGRRKKKKNKVAIRCITGLHQTSCYAIPRAKL